MPGNKPEELTGDPDNRDREDRRREWPEMVYSEVTSWYCLCLYLDLDQTDRTEYGQERQTQTYAPDKRHKHRLNRDRQNRETWLKVVPNGPVPMILSPKKTPGKLVLPMPPNLQTSSARCSGEDAVTVDGLPTA